MNNAALPPRSASSKRRVVPTAHRPNETSRHNKKRIVPAPHAAPLRRTAPKKPRVSAAEQSDDAIFRKIQSDLAAEMQELSQVYRAALPQNHRGRGGANDLGENLRELQQRLTLFAGRCDTMQERVAAIRQREAARDAEAWRAYKCITPVKIASGKLRGYWYCSGASRDFVCRGGHGHAGRQSFGPTMERKKVVRHIEALHRPRTTADGYRSLDWVE